MLHETSGGGNAIQLDRSESAPEMFGGTELWVGQHSGDQDVLIFDPAECDPQSDPLSFYSLGQHRRRSFSRAAAFQKIQPLKDDLGIARARKDYARRDELKASHDQTLADARTERDEQQRSAVLDAHRAYVRSVGATYEGILDDSTGRRRGRRTKCHTCGIALDDFAAASCAACGVTLCSCGACACGSATAGTASADPPRKG